MVTFSMGSMSYLCYFDVAEFASVINNTFLASKELVEEQTKIDYRTRLSCNLESIEPRNTIGQKRMFINSDGGKEVQKPQCHALNEISVTRGNAEFMTRFDVYVNDTLLTTVQGDGILISTPTGSTAYNLSCGGSIVHSGADVICLTPICPHSLSFRPVILPKTCAIKIVLPELARTDAWVTFDG